MADAALRAAVRQGQVVKHGDGIYALPEAAPDVVVAAQLRGRLTCVSAAGRHGLDVLRAPDLPHVAVPRNHPAESDAAVVHRVDSPGSAACVPIFAALLTLARCLPAVEAVVTLDSAVRQRAACVESLRSRLRGPGSVEARRVLGLVDGRSGSVIETVLRLALRQVGVPLDCQVQIDGVGRVDFLLAGWLVVEVDGFAFHSDRSQYRVDRSRANALADRGYVLLRFTFEDVMHDLDRTVATVQSVLRRGR